MVDLGLLGYEVFFFLVYYLGFEKRKMVFNGRREINIYNYYIIYIFLINKYFFFVKKLY